MLFVVYRQFTFYLYKVTCQKAHSATPTHTRPPIFVRAVRWPLRAYFELSFTKSTETPPYLKKQAL